MSSLACVSSKCPSSSQWYGSAVACAREVCVSFKKGVESSRVLCARYGASSSGLAPVVVGGGRIGEGEKTAAVVSAVSKSRIVSKEAGLSQAGG